MPCQFKPSRSCKKMIFSVFVILSYFSLKHLKWRSHSTLIHWNWYLHLDYYIEAIVPYRFLFGNIYDTELVKCVQFTWWSEVQSLHQAVEFLFIGPEQAEMTGHEQLSEVSFLAWIAEWEQSGHIDWIKYLLQNLQIVTNSGNPQKLRG